MYQDFVKYPEIRQRYSNYYTNILRISVSSSNEWLLEFCFIDKIEKMTFLVIKEDQYISIPLKHLIMLFLKYPPFPILIIILFCFVGL